MACEDDVHLDVGSAGAAASQSTTTTTATTTHVIIINLASRRDRRAFMEASCAAPLRDRGVAVEFLDAVAAAACGARACAAYAVHEGFALGDDALDALVDAWHAGGNAAVARSALERYYGRGVLPAEVACARSHVAAWRRAAARFADDAALEKVLVLEDDAVSCLGPVRAADWAGVYGAAWAALVARLAKTTLPSDVDLLYVGRHRLGPDGGPAGAVCYPAGFSSCLHAYALTRRGAARLDAISGNFLRRVVPADDFVPALCGVHPRRDLVVGVQADFVAAALSPEAAHQLCSVALPGDALAGAAASSIEVDGDGWRWARPSLYVAAADFRALAASCTAARDALGDDAAWRALALKDFDGWRGGSWRCAYRRQVAAAPVAPPALATPKLPDASRFCADRHARVLDAAPGHPRRLDAPALVRNVETRRVALDDLAGPLTCSSGDGDVSVDAADFLNYARTTRDADPLLVFDAGAAAALDVPPPACMALDLLEALYAEDRPLVDGSGSAAARLVRGERRWIVAGGAGAGVPWHVDPFGTAAYNMLLSGSKLWAFFEPAAPGNRPPGCRADDSPPARAWFLDFAHFFRADVVSNDGDHAGRLTWALQRAGDCVLLPPGAWHATLNLGEAVGYTRNVVDARCRGVKRAAALLGADDASLAGRLERVARKRRA